MAKTAQKKSSKKSSPSSESVISIHETVSQKRLTDAAIEAKMKELGTIAVVMDEHEIVVKPLALLLRSHNVLDMLDEISTEMYNIGILREEFRALRDSLEIDFESWWANRYYQEKKDAKEKLTETAISNTIKADPLYAKKKSDISAADTIYKKLKTSINALSIKFRALESRVDTDRTDGYLHKRKNRIEEKIDTD